MNTTNWNLKNLIVRRPLLAFFVFSFAFFWLELAFSMACVAISGRSPDEVPGWIMAIIVILGSWTPNLAAAIVTGALEGRTGVKQLFGKFLQWRIAPRWVLAALIPFPVAFAAAGVYRLAFGAAAAPGNAGLSIGFWVGLILLTLLQGATGEEAGWRGFALPRLLQKYGPVRASITLGLCWSFWHLPLWFVSGLAGVDLLVYVLAFCVSLLCVTFLMTWIFTHTSISILPMVLFHFSLNAGSQLVGPDGLGLAPTLPVFVLQTGILFITAIIIWGLNRKSVQNEVAVKYSVSA